MCTYCPRVSVAVTWTSDITGFYHYLMEWVPMRRTRNCGADAQWAARFILNWPYLHTVILRVGSTNPCDILPLPSLHLVCSESRFCIVCVYGPRVTADNMVEVKITEDIRVGGKNPCFIIAEVGQNHQGDIEIAKKLIKAAKVSAGFKILCS